MKRPDPEGAVRFGDNCFVRAAPSAAGAVLGVVRRGSALPRGEGASPDGWLAVVYRGKTGWVSGRFAGASDSPVRPTVITAFPDTRWARG